MCFCLLDFRHQHFICFLSISLTLVLLCPSFLPWGRFPVPEHLTSTHVMFSSGLCKLNCLEFPSSPWPLEHLGKVTFSVPVSSQRSSCSHSAHHVFTPALFSIQVKHVESFVSSSWLASSHFSAKQVGPVKLQCLPGTIPRTHESWN